VTREIAHQSRVQVARTSPHHQPFQGRKAHRRVNRLAVPDGRGRTAVPLMQSDQSSVNASPITCGRRRRPSGSSACWAAPFHS
jgi:hypothetical protein